MRAAARWTGAVIVALSLVAAGCGPDAGDYPLERTVRMDAGTAPDAGLEEIPDEPLEDWDTAGAGPLSGVFAAQVTIPAKVLVDVEARQYFRLRILQRDRRVRLLTQPCRIDLPSVPGVATLTIPRALERVLQTKIVEHEGELLDGADPVGSSFEPPAAVILLGAALLEPATDPLPTAEALGTALDEDGDGNPGVTVDAETVLCRAREKAYLALRAVAELAGTVDSVDALSGAVVPNLEWSILGTSHRCLAAAAELEIEIVPGSRFVAVRVDGDPRWDVDENGNVSCPEISLLAEEIFPPPPEEPPAE